MARRDVSTLLIDARPVVHPETRGRGIGRYVADLIGALHDRGADVVPVVEPADLRRFTAPWSGPRPVGLTPSLVAVAAGGWWIATGMFLRPLTFDPVPRAVTGAKLRVASVLYDVIPYRDPARYQADASARALFAMRAALARSVDRHLAISQFTADTAVEHLGLAPQQVTVIGAAASPTFAPGPIDRGVLAEVLHAPDVPYVLAVTGGDERKNTYGLLQAWAQVPVSVRRATRLVIAAELTPVTAERWATWAEEAGCAGEVDFVGRVSDEQMLHLQRGASLAVMPSLDEGFGLPVLEAAAVGVPALCSNVSALPEVLDTPSATFDPLDPAAMARAVQEALDVPARRTELLDAGRAAAARWTWPAVADRVLDAVAQPSTRDRGRPPATPVRRVALIGPFAGSPSGIGAYNQRVGDAMSRRTDALVERFAELIGTDLRAAPPVHVAADFGRRHPAHDHDDVIATFGSSPYHVAALGALAARPHVWLHESSLVGLHVGRAHRSRDRAWGTAYLRDAVMRNEGADALARLTALDADSLFDPAAYHTAGIRLVGEPVRAARSVIVSSEAAAADVRRADPEAKVLVLPLAVPAAQRVDGPPTRRSMVVAGWLAPNKRAGAVLDVLAHLPPDVTVEFVGPVQGDARDTLLADAHGRGLGERVLVRGALADAEFDDALRQARVGLQLRDGHQGEMSAAVADLIARGIPVVTTLTTTSIYGAAATVMPADTSAADLATVIRPLVEDDAAWQRAASAAITLADAWTFDALAATLTNWLGRVDDLPSGTVEVIRP